MTKKDRLYDMILTYLKRRRRIHICAVESMAKQCRLLGSSGTRYMREFAGEGLFHKISRHEWR